MLNTLPLEIIEQIHIFTNVEDLVKLSLVSKSNIEYLKCYFRPNSFKIYPIDFIKQLYSFCVKNEILYFFCNLSTNQIYEIQMSKTLPNKIIYGLFKLSLDSGDTTTYYDLGRMCYNDSEFGDAFYFFTLFEDHHVDDPNISLVYALLGMMYMKGYHVDKNYVKAEDYYKKSVELGEFQTYYFLGNLHHLYLDNNDDAFKYYNMYYKKYILEHDEDPTNVFQQMSRVINKKPSLLGLIYKDSL